MPTPIGESAILVQTYDANYGFTVVRSVFMYMVLFHIPNKIAYKQLQIGSSSQ